MNFSALPLLSSIQGTLAAQGLSTLTPVQLRALPAMLDRHSVVAVAETGSGKTLCYVLPVLDRLKRLELDGNAVDSESEPRALVVVPTRELGEQVARVFKGFTHDTRLRVRSVLGGQKMRQNRESVAGQFEVLVATPGRLARLVESHQLSLAAMRMVVLDEADQLLDLGFLSGVMDLVEACPSQAQLALFSATMSPQVRTLVGRAFGNAVRIETAGSQKVVSSLRTRHVNVPDGRRFLALEGILAQPLEGGTILFANTHAQCDKLAAQLRTAGRTCVVLHGNTDAAQRRRELREFRAGQVPLLVTTDMGARGLDIAHVSRVVNVHLPRDLESYLHRAGRTARAGRDGQVVNLVTPRDGPLLAQLDDGSAAPTYRKRPRQG